MEGIKHYPIAAFVLFVCEFIAVIIVTMCFQYRKEYDDPAYKDQKMYSLVYYVSYADNGFYEEEAEYLIACMRDIANKYDIPEVRIKNYDDTLISTDKIMSGEEIDNSLLTFLSDSDQSDKDIKYEMLNKKEMTKEYAELCDISLKKGIHINVYQHEEANDKQTEQVGKRIYRILMIGTVILVNFINIISIMTWLMKRKKEYIIKYLFGEPLGKLRICFCIDFLSILLAAFLLWLLIVLIKAADSILYVVKYGAAYMVFAFIQFVLLIIMTGNTKKKRRSLI